MINSNSDLANKLKGMAAVKEYAQRLQCRNNLLATLIVDGSMIPDSDIVRSQIYVDISKRLIGKDNIHVYKLTDKPSRIQISKLVSELSDKSFKQAEYSGIVVVEVPDELVCREEYGLMFEFLDEQDWYTVIYARKNVEKLYRTLAKSVFVDMYKLCEDDIEIASLTEIFKEQYNICLGKNREKELLEYIASLKSNNYDSAYEHILIHQMAYNLILNAVENRNKPLKINDVSDLLKGFKIDELKNIGRVKLGFNNCDLSR